MSSLAKNPMKKFFIRIVAAMIFIKTMMERGTGSGMGGSGIHFLSHHSLIHSLSF